MQTDKSQIKYKRMYWRQKLSKALVTLKSDESCMSASKAY